jgi:lipoprotein
MKKLTTIAILLATSSLAFLTACNPPTKEEMLENNGTDTSYLDYRTLTLKDGRKLECVEFWGGERYGISCNWNNPVNQNNTK